MGNIFQTRVSNTNLSELINRLENLESIDLNSDGIITKDEFNKWAKTQTSELNEFKKILDNKCDEYNKITVENEELKKQVTSLININKNLVSISLKEKTNEQKMANPIISYKEDLKEDLREDENKLSRERINEFVERLLEDSNMNIAYLPDFVERQLYRNVITLVLNLADNFLETTRLQFMGHELKMDIVPK
jgi:hypothetical protein